MPKKGSPVLVVLHTPREKVWGMLDEITAAGVFLRGLDLKAFDDWLRAIVHHEPFIGLSSVFFPMWRVERIAEDETSEEVPSLCQQAEQRTGLSFAELMKDDEGPVA
jgi:hypothetical protein